MMSPQAFVREVAALSVWLVLLVGVFVSLERAFRRVPARRTRQAWAKDVGLYFLNSIVSTVALGVPMAMVVVVSHRLLPASYFAWLNGLPLAVQLVAAMVLGDVGYYWGHRWLHRAPALWRFHAVHHRAEDLDWLIATRAHPVDIVFGRLCGLVPIYLIGLAGRGSSHGQLLAMLFAIVGTAWGFLIHANLRWNMGWIDRFISTPRFHHWHHTADEHANRNFASMVPLIDRVFGTLHMPHRQWPDRYGVGNGNGDVAERDAARVREPA